MSVRNLVLNALFIAVMASCSALAACSGKKGNCEKCTSNKDCSSGNCASFTDKATGDRFLLCADSPSLKCDVTK